MPYDPVPMTHYACCFLQGFVLRPERIYPRPWATQTGRLNSCGISFILFVYRTAFSIFTLTLNIGLEKCFSEIYYAVFAQAFKKPVPEWLTDAATCRRAIPKRALNPSLLKKLIKNKNAILSRISLSISLVLVRSSQLLCNIYFLYNTILKLFLLRPNIHFLHNSIL